MNADALFEGHERFWPPRSSKVTRHDRTVRLSWRWLCSIGRNIRYERERRGWRGYARTLEERKR